MKIARRETEYKNNEREWKKKGNNLSLSTPLTFHKRPQNDIWADVLKNFRVLIQLNNVLGRFFYFFMKRLMFRCTLNVPVR